MIRFLEKIVFEHLLLERLSVAERRVRRTRAMGVELEFASGSGESDVQDELNSYFDGESAFGAELEFGDYNKSGRERVWIVTTDSTASLQGEAESAWDEDALKEDVDGVVNALEELLNDEIYPERWEELGTELREKYEEEREDKLDDVALTLNELNLEELKSIRMSTREEIGQLDEVIDWLENNEGKEESEDRPEMDIDDARDIVDNLSIPRGNISGFLNLVNFDEEFYESADSIDWDEKAEEEDPEPDVELAPLINYAVRNFFGSHSSAASHYDRYSSHTRVWDMDDVRDVVGSFLQEFSPENYYNEEYGEGEHGIEINSPRIAMNQQNFERTGEILEEIIRVLDATTHDDAGLHVHMGIADDVKDIHILRMIQIIADRQAEFVKAGGRSTNSWASSIKHWGQAIEQAIGSAVQTDDASEVESILSNRIPTGGGANDRYYVLNLTTMQTKGTMEVRLGSSVLVDRPGALAKWLNLLHDTYQESLKEDYLEDSEGRRLFIENQKITIKDKDGTVLVQSDPGEARYGLQPGALARFSRRAKIERIQKDLIKKGGKPDPKLEKELEPRQIRGPTYPDIEDVPTQPGELAAQQRKGIFSRRRESFHLERGRHREAIQKQRERVKEKKTRRGRMFSFEGVVNRMFNAI